MIMNDEQFEESLQVLEQAMWPSTAEKLRARDTAQRDALARVEAERDRLAKRLCICHSCGGRGEVHTGQYTDEGQWQPPEPVMVECGECGGDGQIGQVIDLDNAQAQLAEAVGLLRYSQEIARLFDDEHTAEVGRFLARHTQAEQQEAQSPMAKIAEGLRQKAADEWANHPSNPANREAQGAQAGEYPAGAVENGRVLMGRLEQWYTFADDQGHALTMCKEWLDLKECFEHMADSLNAVRGAEQ
ncbi:hypothetical protein [uncultured Pseudomonas sp.]|uniref:hypothetical protein n=1 Tax=uncultured Pseudomonas sp. TaxID=114707 RepID=UPI0025F7B5F5|nr:hypothetical protein [uncultured Pseudomonas sp.]